MITSITPMSQPFSQRDTTRVNIITGIGSAVIPGVSTVTSMVTSPSTAPKYVKGRPSTVGCATSRRPKRNGLG